MKIVKVNDNAVTPVYATENSAGMDLFSVDECIVPAGGGVVVRTGIKAQIPKGCFGGIFSRSGLAFKHEVRVENGVGVIDSDFTGEIKVALHNDSPFDYRVRKGDRIAQMIILPYFRVDFKEVTSLDETERGEGGFGSTGK